MRIPLVRQCRRCIGRIHIRLAGLTQGHQLGADVLDAVLVGQAISTALFISDVGAISRSLATP
jgi:hypothetical protein